VGCSPLVKDIDTLIKQSVTRINERAHRIIVKQVVYNKFIKANEDSDTYVASTLQAQQITESSYVAVPPSTNNNHNHNNSVFKKS